MKHTDSLVAPTGSLLDAAAPTQIPGWDQLARGQSFYLSADWLAFADTDQVGYVAAEALELPANPGRALTLPAHEAAAFTNQAQQAWRGWTE